MNIDGLVALVASGGILIAIAIVIGLSTLRVRRRFAAAGGRGSDPEIATAMDQLQAEVDKGRRGF